MPSKTVAQHNLMEGIARGWKPDKVKGPPVGVAKEFVAADKKSAVIKALRRKLKHAEFPGDEG